MDIEEFTRRYIEPQSRQIADNIDADIVAMKLRVSPPRPWYKRLWAWVTE